MSIYYYLCGHLLSLSALYGFFNGGLASFGLPLITFGLVPLIELLTKAQPDNLSDQELKQRGDSGSYHALVLSIVPLQYLMLALYLWQASSNSWTGIEWLGNSLSMGILCGAYGINAAHELGHRSDKLSRFGAKALLLTSLYMHFFIEHNRGHHAKVATEEDPASARLNETLYQFWLRSVIGSFKSAWALEARRLERKSLSSWSLKNQALRFVLIETVFMLVITMSLGAQALFAFTCAAFIGFSLLEAVNYIEHYGLQRQKNDRGRYEPVTPSHSWNADYPISRVLLFELSRHSDHHAHPRRSYAQLRHFSYSYQLPTGYPGMIVLALFPFLYIPLMNKHIESEAQRVSNDHIETQAKGHQLKHA